MRAARCAATLALLVGAVVGCGDEIPDYQSVWTTTTAPPAATAAAPVPIHQYLDDAGVAGEPVPPDQLTDLTVTIPTPPGWEPFVDPGFAPGTQVIAKDKTWPLAMLAVIQLTGDFDVAEAIDHGNVGAELSDNFKRLNASTEDWRGYPSSMIEGSYDLNGNRMQTYNRIVIATGSPPAHQRYLVQLTVTSLAEEAAANGPDIESILRGFTVAPA